MLLQKEIDMNRDIVEEHRQQFKNKTEQDSPKEECLPQEQILPRRAVLRGILAIGCSLFVPAALFNSATAGAASAAPAEVKKVPKASVHYQTHPNGEKRCGTCVNFIAASNTCKRVEGPVSPNGWCSLWAKKA
jgi:hypothetical protein